MGRGQNIQATSSQVRAPRPELTRHLLWEHRNDAQTENARQVLLDFDSTVFPILDAAREHRHGQKISYETMLGYDQIITDAGGRDNLREMFSEIMTFESMEKFNPFPGVKRVTQALKEHNVRIHVLSDREPDKAEDMRHYLEAKGVPYDEILCGGYGFDKLGWCKERGVEMVIDDHPDMISKAHKSGLDVLTLGFPYNKPITTEHGIECAENWGQLGEQVFDKLEARVKSHLDQARD